MSQSFFELVMINTLIPLRFAYAQKQWGTTDEQIIQWIDAFPPERNSITKGFSRLGLSMGSALDSQALLQLKKFYCDKKDACGVPWGFICSIFSFKFTP